MLTEHPWFGVVSQRRVEGPIHYSRHIFSLPFFTLVWVDKGHKKGGVWADNKKLGKRILVIE